MEQHSIEVHQISKKFGLTLGQSMKYGLRDSLRGLAGFRNKYQNSLRSGEFWAVKDVSFNLSPGEALGIMGVNGSGKTTLLRILNGVYSPDTGTAILRGRVGAMIAAGAGFAPSLSGRENVYVNGALLGMTSREIDHLMDEIISFSELEEFIDLPVKNYSSGMYIRLGFAIAALSNPDVLLMDEVLAVGDLNFQKKCFDLIHSLKKRGTAIVLVSHSPGAIWSICDKGLFMDHGLVKTYGSVEDIIRSYEDQNALNALRSSVSVSHAPDLQSDGEASLDINSDYGHIKGGTGQIICTDCKIVCPDNNALNIAFRSSFAIEIKLKVFSQISDLIVRFTIDAMHYRFIATMDTYEQGVSIPSIQPGDYQVVVKLHEPPLRPGAYKINLALVQRSVGVHLFYWVGAEHIRILSPADKFLYADNNAVVDIDCDFTLLPVSP
ncbi:ABC transporter ATP-binding protein [Synechococcus sp. Cu2B8-bc1011]|uniref:ABC transporter ATP-binding protein n=1 Tax=Synechococcus sp. Cu2B8-bc1011 TaxID=3093725 RepID=UPI0039B06C0F